MSKASKVSCFPHRRRNNSAETTPVSLVVVTWNGWHYLRECLLSVLPQLEASDEIVVVDNGSTDSTEHEIAALCSSQIRYERLAANVGFATANNVGVESSRNDWCFLVNNDTIVQQGTLTALRSAVKEHEEFSIFSCKMVRTSDRRVDNIGITVGDLTLRPVQLGTGSDPDAYVSNTEVFGASGGAMLVHKGVINDIGLFPSSFFAYCEDVDFALRARLAGYRCLFVPEAVVYHKQSMTGSRIPAARLYYIQRNMELALMRNLPLRSLVLRAPFRAAYVLFQLGRAATRGQLSAVLRAKRDALRLWSAMRRTRGPIRIDSGSFRQSMSENYRDTTVLSASKQASSIERQAV